MATTVKITDPSVLSLHDQRTSVFTGAQKQVDKNLPEHAKKAETFKDFEARVNAKDKLYQEATESFIPTDDIVTDLRGCVQEYQGYKNLLTTISLLAERIIATTHFLEPIGRSISEERDFQVNAPALYAQVKEAEKICAERLDALRKMHKDTIDLKKKLTEQIYNPKISASLQRFLSIVDNQGKPLSSVARAFSDAALISFHTRNEESYEATKKEIAAQLPGLRGVVAEVETFAQEVRTKGSIYQNATEPLDPQGVLDQAKQYCEKYHNFVATHEKNLLLEARITKTIQLLIPIPRTPSEDLALKNTNRQLYNETITSEDTCKGYAAQLEKSLDIVKMLNAKLLTQTQDTTTKWALVRICDILKNDCQPLALSSRTFNYFNPYVRDQVIPKPEELKLPVPEFTVV